MIDTHAEKARTKALTKYFAFFAFSQKQLDAKTNNNFKYCSLGAGLIAPTVFADKLVTSLTQIGKDSVKRLKSTHSDRDIIWYELGNHEAQITMDISDTVDAVEMYGITRDQVSKVYQEYFKYCVEEDLF